MISPGRPCESRDQTTGVSLAKNASSTSFNRGHNAVWVPGRAEPVIGPGEGRTRWLARDDVGVRLPIQMSYSDARHASAFSRRDAPDLCVKFRPPQEERAQG